MTDSQGLFDPVNDGISGAEPGESKDDVFSCTTHDIEEMFLGDPFNVGIKGASITDCTSFICGLVYILNGNGEDKFFCGEAVFPDKLPVDARDVGTGVYQCGAVDNFEGVQRGDQLNRNTHRFI